MDAYRTLWPEVELDIISGFLMNPLPLLDQGEAELAIIHDPQEAHPTIIFSPLFRYESVALMSPRHRLAAKPWLDAADFAAETLITYPVPDEMLDVMKHCLTPAGINPEAAHRGIDGGHLAAGGQRARHRRTALLDGGQLYRARLRRFAADWSAGLRCELYAATTQAGAEAAYIREFIALTRAQSLTELAGVSAL